jgi:hypothetical protein
MGSGVDIMILDGLRGVSISSGGFRACRRVLERCRLVKRSLA